MTKIQDTFLQLVRLGLGALDLVPEFDAADWQSLEDMANEQGLLGVMLDGVEKLPREQRPEKKARDMLSLMPRS